MGFLTNEEMETLKENLLNFVSRVSSSGNRTKEEIQILPAIASLLLNKTDCGD